MQEYFKRPDHPDFYDTAELVKMRFSGIRHNSLSDYMELWVEGVRKGEMSQREFLLNPDKWNKLYSEVFGLHNVVQLETKGN